MELVKLTVKVAVIDCLAKQPNRTAKQVFTSLISEGMDVTYQAVHKMLASLEKQGDVVKSKSGYALSHRYVERLERHLRLARQTRFGGAPRTLVDLKENETITIEFDEKMATPYYWFFEELDRLLAVRGKSKKFVLDTNGLWPISILSQREYDIFQRAVKGTRPVVLLRNTKANKKWDDFFKQWWTDLGATIKPAQTNWPDHIDVVVLYDYVLQFEQEKHFADKLLNMAREFIPSKYLANMYRVIFDSPAKIKIHATRNQALAEHHYAVAKKA